MYARENVQFVIDALEEGWTVRKEGKFYEIYNHTSDNRQLNIPCIQNAKSMHALLEHTPSKSPIENAPRPNHQ